jgi:circadian clock protein KaiB
VSAAGGPIRWSLTLYVSGASPRSTAALATIRRICDEELHGRVDLRVVDVTDEPARLLSDQVMAIPTLIKHEPAPLRRLVGDLADAQRVRAALDLEPHAGAAGELPEDAT